jgi:hypothetical protein
MARLSCGVMIAVFLTQFNAIAQADIHTAASCNRDDVNAVINGPTHVAGDGAVIRVPAGTCTWTSGIVVPSGIGITIIGAAGWADGTTTIIHNYTASPKSWLFHFRPHYGASLSRFAYFTLSPQSGLSPNSLMAPLAFQGSCTASGCPNIRVDHVTFPMTPSWGGLTAPSATMIVTDNVFGVLDHNTLYLDEGPYYEFVNFNNSSWKGVGQYGDNDWASPNTFGTNQALYLEDNHFESTGGFFPITETEGGFGPTAQGGGRVVLRFNTGVGIRSMGANHGTESNGRPRGGRSMEFYRNTMSCPDKSYPGCFNNAMLFGAGIRSGSLLAIRNTYNWGSGTGLNAFVALAVYRAQQSIATFGACDGAGQWDANESIPTPVTGTMTVSMSGKQWTITDSRKSWTTNQWAAPGEPYSVHNVTTGDGSEITSNGKNTLTGSFWTTGSFKTGDTYEIRRATACLDQPSRIGGSLLSGNPPSPTNTAGGWTNQTLDPVYHAGDTATGATVFGAIQVYGTARLIANRDYYAAVSQSAQTSASSPFNGTVGTGYGTLANRPSTCTAGVGYWATDQGNWNQSGSGEQGLLYVCTSTNTWTLYYTPYTYPHPLISGATTAPAAPTSLRVVR